MKISELAYNKLLHCSKIPPETGGILGMKNNVIDAVIFDTDKSESNESSYSPNVQFLNEVIVQWKIKNILFAGIFHTHMPQWQALSNADKLYIRCIMQSMPLTVGYLYFPLVFPNKYVKSYIAQRIDKRICIMEDDIETV